MLPCPDSLRNAKKKCFPEFKKNAMPFCPHFSLINITAYGHNLQKTDHTQNKKPGESYNVWHSFKSSPFWAVYNVKNSAETLNKTWHIQHSEHTNWGASVQRRRASNENWDTERSEAENLVDFNANNTAVRH